MVNYLVDVSDIIIFFFLLGRGERGRGSSRPRRRGGGRLSIENPRRGGLPGERGGGGWRLSAGNLGGGGVIFLVGGQNAHQDYYGCSE